MTLPLVAQAAREVALGIGCLLIGAGIGVGIVIAAIVFLVNAA